MTMKRLYQMGAPALQRIGAKHLRDHEWPTYLGLLKK